MEMKVIKEVSLKSDQFYNKAKELGEIAAKAIGSGHKAQMKNLENITLSSLKVSDVLDYIKKQVSRFDNWNSNNFGNRLKETIENSILQDRDEICSNLDIDKSSADAQHIYLTLIREFISQITVHYEYTLTEEGR